MLKNLIKGNEIKEKFMNLKEIRKKNNKNQKEVADYLNVMQSTYSGYESGRVEMGGETIIKLAKYFDVTTDEILGVKKQNLNLTQKSELLSKLDSLTESEFYKLNVFADALLTDRKERQDKINTIINEE